MLIIISSDFSEAFYGSWMVEFPIATPVAATAVAADATRQPVAATAVAADATRQPVAAHSIYTKSISKKIAPQPTPHNKLTPPRATAE